MGCSGYSKILIFICSIVVFFSCATTKKVRVKKKVKAISDSRLYNTVIDSSLNYTAINFKKFSLSVENNGKKKTYKGVMRIQRDSAIWISMTAPLGIEVARVLITQDSVKFVDRYHKEFFVGDFDLIAAKFNNDFDFFTIQSILTNRLFEFPKYDDKPFVRRFRGKVKNDMYLFYTFNERKLGKKYKRVERQMRRNKESSFIYQCNFIDPDSFRVTEVLIDELVKDWRFNIKYSDFKRMSGKLFPKKLYFWVESPDKRFTCDIAFGKMFFTEKVKLSFKIPGNYKRIK